MPIRSLSHVADEVLLRDLATLVRKDRATTADLLAHIAEVDARALYGPKGFASMFLYCVGVLKLSPDVAAKRIQAARAARAFPVLLDAVEDGRLNVSAIVLLAPHLTPENAGDLVKLAARHTSADIKSLLAHRALGLTANAEALTFDTAEFDQRAAGAVTERSSQQDLNPIPAPGASHNPAPAMGPLSPPDTPMAPALVRFPLHASITQATRDKIAYARALLGHAVPGGDVAEVLDRAFDALIAQVEKQRFGVGARTRPTRRRRAANERAIPMAVRGEVLRRDGGHCTFVGDTGHRCESSHRLQFDHVLPLARGGLTTATNLRLRCSTHNQLEAERTFGAAFMRAKRERAAVARAAPPAPAWQHDVLAALRTLGFRDREARRALAACDLGPDASLEQRVRAALRQLAPPAARRAPAA